MPLPIQKLYERYDSGALDNDEKLVVLDLGKLEGDVVMKNQEKTVPIRTDFP